MERAAGGLERVGRGDAVGGGTDATVRSLSGLVRMLIARAAEGLSRHARNRRVLTRLTRMSDRELRDIGLTRGDVADASSLSGGGDASLLLVARRDERRASRRP